MSDGSAHLKNMDTNSSGVGVVGDDFSFIMLEITIDGKPLAFKASATWLVSRLLPSMVLGRLAARNRRVEAAQTLCFNS